MKVMRVNGFESRDQFVASEGKRQDRLSSMVLEGAGVRVGIFETDSAIDISVDPIGENFISRVRYGEVYASTSQARLSVRGESMLDDPDSLRSWVGVELSNAADRLAHHRFEDPAADIEEILSKLIKAIRG